MRAIRLSTPANDAAFDALGSAQRYMSDFVPATFEESLEAKQVLKSIKNLLKEVHNREGGSNEKEKVDDYYIKGEQVLLPFGDGDWDADIIHNDG